MCFCPPGAIRIAVDIKGRFAQFLRLVSCLYPLALCCTLVTVPAMALESQSYTVQPAPTLPFFDWNACPFEGCTYGRWTALASVDVFDTWKPNRKRVATLLSKNVVTGVSGVVITYKTGVIRVNKDIPQDGLRRGDTILTYTYRGEGLSAVWFKGRFYREYDITFAKWPDGTGCLRTDCAGTYVDLGKKSWWAKVKIGTGIMGWVNMDRAEFEGVDMLAFSAPASLLSLFAACPTCVKSPAYLPTLR
jgi:hypothetical protein